MQYSPIRACLLALAAAATVLAQTAGFDPISRPSTNEVLAAGSTYDIEWTDSGAGGGSITLTLLQGASNITLQLGPVIKAGIPSLAGKYAWSVPASAYSVYGIQLSLDGNATIFQYSNPFSISGAIAGAAKATMQTSQLSTLSGPTSTKVLATGSTTSTTSMSTIVPIYSNTTTSTMATHVVGASSTANTGLGSSATNTGTVGAPSQTANAARAMGIGCKFVALAAAVAFLL